MLEEIEADNPLRGKSIDIVDGVWLSPEIGSMTPKSVAACSIYVASRFPDVDAEVTQTEMASVADCSTNTVETNWETIYEVYTGESILDGRSVDLEQSEPTRGSDRDESWRRTVLREEFPETGQNNREDEDEDGDN
jgi:hypothetical protein